MVKHIVTFKLKGTPEERRAASEKFAAALNALPEAIPCLLAMETGINENPAESWDVVLIATIDSMENVEVYAKHPAHVAAAAIVGPLKENRACVDYIV
ncbi:MAG: Dabb family protein [Muribaculaceae bacterium]|nr:Dabb family protein [Muribaculaceae bacterium]